MGSIQFVNYLGAEVSLRAQTQAPKRKTNGGGLIFKGLRVVGIPPGALEAAKEKHDKGQKRPSCVGFTPFDEEVFFKPRKKKNCERPALLHTGGCRGLRRTCEKSGLAKSLN